MILFSIKADYETVCSALTEISRDNVTLVNDNACENCFRGIGIICYFKGVACYVFATVFAKVESLMLLNLVVFGKYAVKFGRDFYFYRLENKFVLLHHFRKRFV